MISREAIERRQRLIKGHWPRVPKDELAALLRAAGMAHDLAARIEQAKQTAVWWRREITGGWIAPTKDLLALLRQFELVGKP